LPNPAQKPRAELLEREKAATELAAEREIQMGIEPGVLADPGPEITKKKHEEYLQREKARQERQAAAAAEAAEWELLEPTMGPPPEGTVWNGAAKVLLNEYREVMEKELQAFYGWFSWPTFDNRAGVEQLLRSQQRVQDVIQTRPPMLRPQPPLPHIPPPRAVPPPPANFWEEEDDPLAVDVGDERVAPQGMHTNYMITVSGQHPTFPIDRFMAHHDIVYYIVYQQERGTLRGHLHWHAYVEFAEPVPATWVRTTFFGDVLLLWIRPARNRYACRKYVRKRDGRVPGTLHEWGQFRMPNMRGTGVRVGVPPRRLHPPLR
jgi:hypothetical protein